MRARVSREGRSYSKVPSQWLMGAVWFATAGVALADSPSSPPLPDMGTSVLRVIGALLLVLGLFFGGVWLFKNSSRVLGGGNGGSRLQVLEVKSLGNRQGLYVVAYGRQRLLVGSCPTGISLVSHLPEASEEESSKPAPQNFSETLQRVLNRK